MWGATVRTNIDICHSAISIHAPRVGSDIAELISKILENVFQSTLPVWGATNPSGASTETGKISIHAPRVGSDECCPSGMILGRYFNPRSPCGERRARSRSRRGGRGFQSTLPVWGATAALLCGRKGGGISIHAPRVGSDCRIVDRFLTLLHFNPRSPCGERPDVNHDFVKSFTISIHAPRVGSD